MALAFWKGLTSHSDHSSKSFKNKAVDAILIGYVFNEWFAGGAPSADSYPAILSRLEWLEETFRPMCIDG